MKCYSIEFNIPDVRPFDAKETWFESFVGSVYLPVITSGLLSRFWFSRYGAVTRGKTSLFRFETDHSKRVMDQVDNLVAQYRVTHLGLSDYDIAGDIGQGERSRFLGTNAKHRDTARRGDLAFTFLHASGCLMLDCLVGPDANGYFALESEKDSGFSKESTMEQFHHLFCNMSRCPTYLAIAQEPGTQNILPVTYEEYKRLRKLPGWGLSQPRRGEY